MWSHEAHLNRITFNKNGAGQIPIIGVPFKIYKWIMHSIYPSDTLRLETMVKYAPEAGRQKK